ncbi:hypothetical protein RHMOL_Rhmol11G0180600 [Rhododendron molle]|uniref:Uncharacterized protein n=1 Tax=Rhododendron molle TaxID=49168 RepID=A0ACC0LU43_RHOML|nr:hypothetical protein RHMOL_Rhmol11G0180600 [Rhododendron molle]
MKLAKAIKKLKFWSRKKKKNKYYIKEPSPPPPTFHYYHSWVPVQPSAPPLPPWFDHEQDQYSHFGQDSGMASSSRAEFSSTQEEISPDLNSMYSISASDVGNDASYQQYMVSTPVYGVPVLPAVRRREKAAGFFGCFVGIGTHLIRCFFPCFHDWGCGALPPGQNGGEWRYL